MADVITGADTEAGIEPPIGAVTEGAPGVEKVLCGELDCRLSEETGSDFGDVDVGPITAGEFGVSEDIDTTVEVELITRFGISAELGIGAELGTGVELGLEVEFGVGVELGIGVEIVIGVELGTGGVLEIDVVLGVAVELILDVKLGTEVKAGLEVELVVGFTVEERDVKLLTVVATLLLGAPIERRTGDEPLPRIFPVFKEKKVFCVTQQLLETSKLPGVVSSGRLVSQQY